MSAVWLKLITLLFLFCTALSGQEKGGVVWRDFGGAITIHCRPPQPQQEFLTLKSGLTQYHVFGKEVNSVTHTTNKDFVGRLQSHGVFPSLDILIKNLTSNDTGPYWCFYSKLNPKTSIYMEERGEGSVLLVVTDTVKQCEGQKNPLVQITVGILTVILVAFITGFFIWIFLKTKTQRCKVKQRHITTNEVYEDMRGTLRH